MIELLLKSSVAIGVALLFYKLLLQKESFFATNRLYLLGCLVLAFALPFINLPQLINQQGYLSTAIEKKLSGEQVSKRSFSAFPEELSQTQYSLSSNYRQKESYKPEPVQPTAAAHRVDNVSKQKISREKFQVLDAPSVPVLSTSSWLMLFYFFGVAVLGISLLFQVGYIISEIIRSQDKIRDGDYIIVNTATRRAPCSFFKYIFIYPDDYDFATYEQIIKHEKTHVRLGHSFDLLLAELAVIVLWFNPLMWLFKKEIEKNNEYQTDAILVEKQKVRKDQYQLNLLQIAVPNKPLNITTNYNQSLIKKRIVMMNSKRSTPHAYWKYAFLVPLFVGMLLVLNEPAKGQETQQTAATPDQTEATASQTPPRQAQAQAGKSTDSQRRGFVARKPVSEANQLQENIASVDVKRESSLRHSAKKQDDPPSRTVPVIESHSQVDMTEGVWYSRIRNGKYCIQFRGNSEDSSWNISDCFDSSRFIKENGDTFIMKNEAGTLELKGNLDAEVAQGTYLFKENASFRNVLDQKQVSGVTNNTMFHLFFAGMTRNYLDFILDQYPDLNAEELTAIAIHDIEQEQFRSFVKLFKKHSTGNPDIDDIIGLKIHGVTEKYVQELQDQGFTNLSLEEIMAAKIHGVSAAYYQDLRAAGFTDLSMDEIVTAKIHDVAPQTIKEMRALGAQDLDEIVALQIHGINAEYVEDLQSAGLKNLSHDEIVSAKIHGLDASTINKIRSLGFKNLDFDDLITAQVHGVDSSFVQDLEQAGFADLKMDEVVSARIHGINRKFIENARKNGYDLKSIDKYISLKIHGEALESLRN